jgi:hypothetical protein
MEMRRRMIPPKHLNHDSIEDTYLSAHGASITLPAIRATPGHAYLVVFSLSLAFSQLRNDPRG